MTTQLIISALTFLLMIVSGIIVSRKGRPYNKAFFAVHKIFTLVTIVLLVILAINYLKGTENKMNQMVVVFVTASLFFISFVSGALLSFEKVMPPFLTTVHRVSSLLVVLTTLSTGWILMCS